MVSNEDIYAITENVFTTMVDSHVEIVENSSTMNRPEPNHRLRADRRRMVWRGHRSDNYATGYQSGLQDAFTLEDDAANLTDCQDSIAELTEHDRRQHQELGTRPVDLSLPECYDG